MDSGNIQPDLFFDTLVVPADVLIGLFRLDAVAVPVAFALWTWGLPNKLLRTRVVLLWLSGLRLLTHRTLRSRVLLLRRRVAPGLVLLPG